MEPPKPKITLKAARDLRAGDLVSSVGVWYEVAAVTPVYLNSGLEVVTIVLRDLGSDLNSGQATPVSRWADLKMKTVE